MQCWALLRVQSANHYTMEPWVLLDSVKLPDILTGHVIHTLHNETVSDWTLCEDRQARVLPRNKHGSQAKLGL